MTSCLNTNYSINEQEGPGMLISLELLPLICVEIGFHALSWAFLADSLQTFY